MKKINRILFIDDDEANNFLNSILIESLDLSKNVSFALNGKEALDILENCSDELEQENSFPNAIFVDINMPIMDGFEFMNEYIKVENWKNKDVLICMLTSSLDPTDKARAKEIDKISEFVAKPLTRDAIKEIWLEYFK